MKLKFTTVLFLFFTTHITFSQQINTRLTKIERSVDVGEISDYYNPSLAPFYHGVASGDPLEDAVMIWTRVTTNQSSVEVIWKIATDPQMKDVVNKGRITTNQIKDYTVKVDVQNLQSYRTYYYQFEALGVSSIIGKTRTTPAHKDMVDNLRFAVVSCSNYQNGYFNAYNQIANRSDIDAVIHLGDYIYEYESGQFGYSKEVGRGHVPEKEAITLDDYRVRHSYYKLDPMLRNIHQNHPFINIWDDHEFANDASKFGAANHSPNTEGDWQVRKNNAFKAYFEWMPIRANSIEEYRLYRTIKYGKLMDLILLDTRIEGRDTQVHSSKNLISTAAENNAFKSFAQNVIAKKDLTDENELKEILYEVLPMVLNISGEFTKSDDSSLSEDELAQVVETFAAVVLNKGSFQNKSEKINLENLLNKSTKYKEEEVSESNKATYKSILGSEQFSWLKNELQSSTAKWRIIGNQVMVMPWNGVPSNDAWDGYSREREELLKYIKSNDINNLVVLTGDIHTTFVGEVNYKGDCQMCEFVVPSVTSTNLDFLGGVVSGLSEFYIKLLNNHIKDVDLDNHGYYVLDVRQDRVQADWFDTNDVKRAIAGETRSRSWYVNNDNCKLRKASSAAVLLSKEYDSGKLSNMGTKKDRSQDDFVMMGVYPNPMSDQGNVHFIVNNESQVHISLYDLNGRKVSVLANNSMNPGIYNLSFDITTLQQGNYFITVATEKTKVTRTITVK